MCDVFKSEFTWKNCGFSHRNRKAFYTCQWQWPPWLFLLFRLVVLGYVVGAFIPVIVPKDANAKHSLLVYLTIWTYSILIAHNLIATIVALFYHCMQERDEDDFSVGIASHRYHVSGNRNSTYSSFKENTFRTDADAASYTITKESSDANTKYQAAIGTDQSDGGLSLKAQSNGRMNSESETRSVTTTTPIMYDETEDNLSCLMKFSWLLSALAQHFSIFVTLLYFTAVFPFLRVRADLVNDINLHAVNSFVVLLDLAVSARPVRYLHVLYPAIYGCAYTVFSIVYWTFDKESNVIYAILDWNNPALTLGVIAGAILIVVPLIQCMLFGLYRLRLKIYNSVYKHSYT
ncbi:uncharacterized protein LOC110446705 [Mizuhopecten yessoensis]|uniref:Protein rolling stone n=1 Tax=Mizuhopecten yessoensis TaxID=6573 RepID=A0A210QWZ1_MIZYE|nr:uncharacterized protein LOC110446705 [Mizuhopecten yessoensis]OWF53226.1 Protein rolling stone [Mizuhopecten yessoensis]